MKKILYFLLTGPQFKNRQENILKTWGKNKDLFFYSDYADVTNKVLKVCESPNLELKMVSIFKKIQENFHNQYEWYFFGDDDTFVNTKLLEFEIDKYNKFEVHGRDGIGCWRDLHFPSGGAGFLISNSIIDKFFNSTTKDCGYSDVCFGLNMKERNITLRHNSKILGLAPSFHEVNVHDIPRFISFHYIRDFYEMDFMNKICQKFDPIEGDEPKCAHQMPEEKSK